MNPRYYLPIAFLVSLLAHIILIAWILAMTPLRQHDGQEMLQVFIQQNADAHGRKLLSHAADAALAANKIQTEKRHPALEKLSQMPDNINMPPDVDAGKQTTGNFQWNSQSPIQQEQIMKARQQAQFAQQRESRKAEIAAGLSNLSNKLRPIITGKIVCLQQPENEIKCTPEQNKAMHALLMEFSKLALEAHKFGMAGNLVSLDFGNELNVSITLPP